MNEQSDIRCRKVVDGLLVRARYELAALEARQVAIKDEISQAKGYIEALEEALQLPLWDGREAVEDD